MVLMEDWSLSHLPLAVSVGNRRILGENAGDVPVEQVWVVGQCLGMDSLVVENDWPASLETTAKASNDEPADVEVGEPAPDVKVPDRQLSDDEETEQHSQLSSRGIGSKVPVRAVGGPCDDVLGPVSLEPRPQNSDVPSCFLCQVRHVFFQNVL